MFPRRIVPLVFALVAVCIAGCASFPRRSDDVSVSLIDVRSLETRSFESSLVLTVRVTNAGTEPLRLSGARHRLVVNGRALGVALSSDALEVAALSTATQEATFNLSHLGLIPLASELRREPVAAYQIESTFFSADWASRGIAVRQNGRVDLSALAGFPGAGAGR